MATRAMALKVVGVVLVLVAACVMVALWADRPVEEQGGETPKAPYSADASELLAIYSAESSTLVANLSSERPIIVMESANILKKRGDRAGQEKARELLRDSDEYVWFNAALYLGALGDETAIPYLIKGLEHRAQRSKDEVVSYLELLTQERHGKDQDRWIAWWQEQHPESDFDFAYEGR